MKFGWALVVLPLLAGCLGGEPVEREVMPADVGYDAADIRIHDVLVEDATITSYDGTELEALVYVPKTSDTVDGMAPTFPVVVFVHPFGFPKETYENLPLADDSGNPLPPTNVMDEFARAGIISVAYDTRGWFGSGGTTSIAGPAEMRDLDEVLTYMEGHYATSGLFGATGISYGGGHAMLAWANNDRITTVVPMNGWVDLYDGLNPGNVPKSTWGASFAILAAAETGIVRLGDDVPRWMTDAFLRQNLDDLESELDLRSILTGEGVNKPIFTCQGLQETAFHQSHRAWETTEAFARAHYYTGGHNTVDRDCVAKARQWFQFFLVGIDTKVDEWPLVSTADLSGETRSEFRTLDDVETRTLYLAQETLQAGPLNSTFTIEQRLLANPLSEPAVFWDTVGLPYQEVPAQFRQDPTAVTFRSAPFQSSNVVLGAPTITLEATNETREGPWQVVATLFHESEGSLQIAGRTAYAVIDSEDHHDGIVMMELPWTHIDVAPGDALVLKIASNEPTLFAPLQANYAVDFTGYSSIEIPFFAPERTE